MRCACAIVPFLWLTACGGGDSEPDPGRSDGGGASGGDAGVEISPEVVPIDWSAFTRGAPDDEDSLRARAILLNVNRYGLTTWWNEAKNFDAQTGDYLDFGGIAEGAIRPPAMEALALATALALDVYDPDATGVPVDTARERAIRLIVSLARAHKVTTAGGWGDHWQSALWATYTGTAGWLLWQDLPRAEKEPVRAMVEYEARRFIGYQVPYYRDLAGAIVTPGDTKAEENAWNAGVLQLAVTMMPHHPEADAWSSKLLELMISSFARPGDLASPSLVHRRPLSRWLRGSNANDDGTLVNHGFVHPDYMTTTTINTHAAIYFSLVGRPTPEGTFVGAAEIYRALVDLDWQAGQAYPEIGDTARPPGGTIYVAGSANIYYPHGNDWGTSRRLHFAQADAHARHFVFDHLASRGGASWEPLHAGAALAMQERHADGRMYAAATEDTYSGREEWAASIAAYLYLTSWIAHQQVFERSDAPVPLVIDNRDVEFSVVSGEWSSVADLPERLGADVRAAPPAGDGGEGRVRWTPDLAAGTYEVEVWWPDGEGHASDARFTVVHSGGEESVRVDQRAGGRWTSLGRFSFADGIGGYVELGDDSASGMVIADAVAFVRLDE